jgi:hypothetical protein
MNLKLSSTIILLILTITLTPMALAQTITVGVKPGNSFDYDYTNNWKTNDPTATVPTEYRELNNTQFIRVSVISVVNSMINVDFTRHFSNGTEQTQNGNIDFNTQLIEIPYGMIIIRGNAQSGEKIYPSGGHATLNAVSTKSYSIGQINTIEYSFERTSYSGTQKINIIYNQETGVAMEYFIETQEITDSYTTTASESLICTDIVTWTGDSNPSNTVSPSTPSSISYPTIKEPAYENPTQSYLLPILVVIVIVAILAILLMTRSGRKKKSRVDEEFAAYIKH